jgi:hypothetical protein
MSVSLELKCEPDCRDPYCLCKPRTPRTPETPPADATQRSIIFPDTKFPNDSNDVRNSYVFGEEFHGKPLAAYRELAEGTLRSAGLEFNSASFDRLSALTDDIRYRAELYEAFRLISLHDALIGANENREFFAGFLQFAIDNGAVADPPPAPDRSLHEYLQRVATEIRALGERIAAREAEPDAARGWKLIVASREGHETVYGTPDQKRERYKCYQDAIDLVWREGMTPTEVSEMVAPQFKVHPRTIRRHTSIPPRP